jgi:MFS family permease
MTLLGVGNAGGQLSRYAAADLYPPHRRGMAMGAVVWAGTVGAVGGPLLMMPSQHAADTLGWSPMSGPFALAAVAVIGALLVAAATPRMRPTLPPTGGRPFRIPAVRTAAATMVTAQVVMVAVMVAAPLSMHTHHADLAAIGTVLSAHALGMFALAPFSGWLLDRIGPRAVMSAGLTILAGSATFVATSPGSAALTGALFLLGYGWNLGMVGGSGVLAGDAASQGGVDALSWGSSTLATTASTLMFVHGGYAPLALAAAILCTLPFIGLTQPAVEARTTSPACNPGC